MSSRVYGVCSDVLLLAAKFPLAPSLPPAAELRQRLHTALDTMVGRGRAAGIADADLAEVRYALVAFIDEQILKSNWPGRAEWMQQPLQLVLYNQFNAGELFFARMRNLLNEGNRPEALSGYALCLLLGFHGQYGVSGDPSGTASFLDAARQQLGRLLPPSNRLAPHAEPGDRARQRKVSNAPIITFMVGALALALACVFGLERLLAADVRRTLDSLPATVVAEPRR